MTNSRQMCVLLHIACIRIELYRPLVARTLVRMIVSFVLRCFAECKHVLGFQSVFGRSVLLMCHEISCRFSRQDPDQHTCKRQSRWLRQELLRLKCHKVLCMPRRQVLRITRRAIDRLGTLTDSPLARFPRFPHLQTYAEVRELSSEYKVCSQYCRAVSACPVSHVVAVNASSVRPLARARGLLIDAHKPSGHVYTFLQTSKFLHWIYRNVLLSAALHSGLTPDCDSPRELTTSPSAFCAMTATI
jgi:hypothetical protein